jgi:hypothetical protein
MTRRCAEFWMLWLLPLLVMRLLLPTGVMPARSSHGVALVLCRPQPIRSAPAAGHTHAEALCPFASAAPPAPPATLVRSALAATPSDHPSAARQAQCSGQSGAPRSQLVRAPPSFLLK